MTLKLKPTALPKEIDLPSSKSYANRLLIIAARLGGGRVIRDLPKSDDVINLINCLRKVGLQMIQDESAISFQNTFPECEPKSDITYLNVGEGGTTARFLLSLLSTGKRKYVLKMEGRLSKRPWEDLIKILRVAGASIDWVDSENLSIQGPVDANLLPLEVSCRETTQFITSLQIVFFKENKFFRPINLKSSNAYWDMTLQCLKDFKEQSIPKDWSGASYPMALAAIRGDEVLFTGLKKDPYQADSILLDLLAERGCVELTPQGIKVSGMKIFAPFEIDGSKCLDLIPTLVVLALKLQGTSIIKNTQGLRSKESDRQQEILVMLKNIGANFCLQDETLEIVGPHNIGEMDLHPVADHRMVMMAALILLSNKGGEISNESAVSKSFANFFEILAPPARTGPKN